MTSEDLKKKCQHYRISLSEHEKITQLLGHAPKGLEWAVFSALWSEHCSYKSSKVHLRKFSYRNSSVLDSEGENAGVVDLGEGERIAFKMESHNHPSFIEPFQGAATGVGGILRDIFTMGARPIALADYLCFGEPSAPRMKELVKGVVSGISSYGNCVGVPTVTGQTEFHRSYNNNILVNAMAVGLITEGMNMALSKAQGPGNWVVYVGAKTGKDGVHGASMASESFGDNLVAKKPNVQIGDPFYEKLLIESCLDVLEKNLVVAMQDMGAAGLTSSSFEMAAKGNVGMELHLDQVPLRDSTITPEEILLSESQERMLLICKPEKFEDLKKSFHHWGLEAQKIGVVTDHQTMKFFWHNEVFLEIDPRLVVDQAPRYEREYTSWKEIRHQSVKSSGSAVSMTEQLNASAKDVRFCSREWIYRQYDQRVGARTARDASSSTAVLKLPSGRALAINVGCRPWVMRLDARLGGIDSVLYPALQMAVKGARAVAVTDCLNFGNPEKKEIMSEFVAAVEGIAEMAKCLDAPVVSGNVSFYNETQGQNITSTPATGLIGVRDHIEKIPSDTFTKSGLNVFLLSHTLTSNLEEVAKFAESLREMVMKTSPEVSRVVGSGGVLEALRKMMLGGIGFKCDSSIANWTTAECTQENFYEFVFAVSPSSSDEFLKAAEGLAVKIRLLGQTQDDFFEWKEKVSVKELNDRHKQTWSETFKGFL